MFCLLLHRRWVFIILTDVLFAASPALGDKRAPAKLVIKTPQAYTYLDIDNGVIQLCMRPRYIRPQSAQLCVKYSTIATDDTKPQL